MIRTNKQEVIFRGSEKIIPKYYDLYRDIMNHEYTHYKLYGGRGSTKSSFISEIIPHIIINNPNVHACVFRKVGNTLKNSVYGQMQWGIDQTDGLYSLYKFKVNPMEMIYRPTGQKIMFFGLDDPGKIKSIKLPFGYIGVTWFEEEDQYAGDAEIRKVLQSTMRGGDKFWDFRSFNPPISASNWANKDILVDRPDTLCIKSSYLDVPREWLGESFYDEADWLKAINPRAYTHEYLGEAIGDGGNVFENVKVQPITDEQIKTFDRIYMGVDWGWYPDPFAWVKVYYDSARRDLYIYDEYVVNKKGNADVWKILQEKKSVLSSDLITADSAEPKSISDFRSYGSNTRGAEKGPGSIEYSMKWLQSLNHIYIDLARCPVAADEFLTYEYTRNKDDEIISDYPDENNHCLTGDTIVNTVDGDIAIKDLVGKTGKVYCYDEDNKKSTISDYFDVRLTQKDAEIYEITLEDGSSIKATAEHPVLTTRGWIKMCELTTNDEILNIY